MKPEWFDEFVFTVSCLFIEGAVAIGIFHLFKGNSMMGAGFIGSSALVSVALFSKSEKKLRVEKEK
ncbi:MAG: hypothetical protein H8Z69_01220 [Nanohaloarchaea archaeon]|nr:hypothetical protein [Candidatus Nanohaloarchaea archaeon]